MSKTNSARYQWGIPGWTLDSNPGAVRSRQDLISERAVRIRVRNLAVAVVVVLVVIEVVAVLVTIVVLGTMTKVTRIIIVVIATVLQPPIE
jgi:hypothetical protein